MQEAGPSRRELLPQRLLAQLNEMTLPELAFEAQEAKRGEHQTISTVSPGWHREILFRRPP